MKFDLHMHSKYSRDGEFSPAQLMAFIQEKQLGVVALTDHNEVLGIDEMIHLGNQIGVHVIPAIEFDSLFENRETHILGYGINHKDEYYAGLSRYINMIMDDVTELRIKKFEEVYQIKIDRHTIYSQVQDGVNPFFIICQYLFTHHSDIEDFKPYLPGGHRSDPAVPNFFWDLCKYGKKNYVPVPYPDIKEVIDRIHNEGGLAILAHPHETYYKQEELLQKAITLGIDGIEAYSNYHTPVHNEYYEAFCNKNNLLMTLGSDFHGYTKPSIELGEYGYEKQDASKHIQTFLEALNK